VNLNNEKIISYDLDWDERRISRSLNGSILVRKIYESELQLAAEVDSITGNRKEYVYGTHINSPDYLKAGPDTYRIIKNHLGSPQLVVNVTDGTIVQRMDYNGWGEVVLDSNPGFQAFGFAGGLYDQDTKLVKFGARDYDASIGRWLSKDPILSNGGDMNLYDYVMQDPINWIDPEGKAAILPTVGIVWGAYLLYLAYKDFTRPPEGMRLQPIPLDQYRPKEYPNLDLPHPYFNNRENMKERKQKQRENNNYYNRSC
jgi:RHS repeat-associated protein